MSAEQSRIWFIRAPEQHHWRRWDDEFVLYDELSGQTHLLNFIAADAMRLLQETPRSDADLATALAELYRTELTSEFCSRIRTLLSHFQQLGLTEDRLEGR